MVRYLRNTLMAKLGGESTELLQISADERARAARTACSSAKKISRASCRSCCARFDDLNYRQEQRFHLELGLLKLVHAQRLIPARTADESATRRPACGQRRQSLTPQHTSRASCFQYLRCVRTFSAHSAPQPAPPRSVASTEAARGGSVASSTPPQPTFSPFESDTRRKSGPSGSAATEPPTAAQPLEVPAPVIGTAVALDEPPASSDVDEALSLQHEPPDLQIRGHVSPEAERIVADLEEEIASDDLPEPPASGEFTSLIDKLRDAVCQALHDKGHETASALLRAGHWSLSDSNTITVSVAVRKTMLSLTMNPEAERIARTAMQQAGSSAKLVVLPGDGSGSSVPSCCARRQGQHSVARARQSTGEAGAGALPRRGSQHP